MTASKSKQSVRGSLRFIPSYALVVTVLARLPCAPRYLLGAGGVGAGVLTAGGVGAGVLGAGAAGAGAGAGAGVTLPDPSAVAAAVEPVLPARRARNRSNKPALANSDIRTTATMAIR